MSAMYITLLFVIAIAFGLFILFPSTPIGMVGHHGDKMIENYEIYPSYVARKIEKNRNIFLLDVRTLEEYEEKRLKGSLLLPLQELSQKSLNKVGLGESYKDKEIIIYCRTGARSKTAYEMMKSLGYTNIKSMAGGMIHWEEDEYPFVEKTQN